MNPNPNTIAHPENKHQPNADALLACKDVIQAWQEKHPALNVEVDTFAMQYTLASRVRSWISPLSVIAGTKDIATPFISRNYPGLENMGGIIEDLGEALARRLADDELLTAIPRRSRIGN